METQNNEPKKMKTGLKVGAGMLGAVMVGGLFAGGGTLALWNDSVQTEPYQLTAGTLEIAQNQALTATDLNGGGGDLDLEDLQIAPGQEIQFTKGYDIALDGENLIGQIDTTELQAAYQSALEGGEGYDGVTITNVTVTTPEGTPATEGNVYYFGSEQNTTDMPGAGTPTTVARTLDGETDLQISYTVEFDRETPESVGKDQVVANLNSVDLVLEQVATWQ